jgi:hypothetical protein
MKKLTVLERPATAPEAVIVSSGGEYALSLAVWYHDEPTLSWAGEVYQRVRQLAGKGAVRSTWWNINSMNEPGIMAGAVSAAAAADVMVIATRAARELPLAFYAWADAWLPRRQEGLGALVALIGQPGEPSTHSAAAEAFLRAMARRARLDFLVEKRKLPLEALEAPHEPASQPAFTVAQNGREFASPLPPPLPRAAAA